MNNLQKLYQTIFEAGLINNSFDDFSNAMLGEDYQKKVFDAITQLNLFNQDFNTFKSGYTETKKKFDVGTSDPSMQLNEDGSIGSKVADVGALKNIEPGEAGFKEPATTIQEKLAIGAYSMVSAYNGIADYANAIGTNVEVFFKELDGDELDIEEKQDIFARNKTFNISSEILETKLSNYIGREGGTISNAIKEGKY